MSVVDTCELRAVVGPTGELWCGNATLGFIKNRSYPAVTYQVDEEQDVDYLSSSWYGCTPSIYLLSPDNLIGSKPVEDDNFSKTSAWPKTLFRRTRKGLLYGVLTSSSPPNVKLCFLTLPFMSSLGWLGGCESTCLGGVCLRIPADCFPGPLAWFSKREYQKYVNE